MKILVTGGGGFIAQHFIEKLQQKNYELVMFDVHPFTSKVEHKDINYIRGDIRDIVTLRKAAEGCDRVLHLAAAHHDYGISDATFAAVNIEGTQILCDVMTELGIHDLCFYSSVAVFGDAGEPKSEQTKPIPNSPYGTTKLGAEEVIQRWTETNSQNDALIIRPTVTFGPDNYANMFSLIKQIDSGIYVQVGDGSNLKSLSYVENIVDATLFMWDGQQDNERGFQLYNYVCKPDLTSSQIATIVTKSLGRKPSRFRIPFTFARILAMPFDLFTAITGKNLPISTARIRKLAIDQTKFESDKIREAGYQQTISLEAGIDRMVKWYLSEGKKKAEAGLKPRIAPEKVYKQEGQDNS